MRVLPLVLGPGAAQAAHLWLTESLRDDGGGWDRGVAVRLVDESLSFLADQGADSVELVLRTEDRRLRMEVHADFGALPPERLLQVRRGANRLTMLLGEFADAWGAHVVVASDRLDPVVWFELATMSGVQHYPAREPTVAGR